MGGFLYLWHFFVHTINIIHQRYSMNKLTNSYKENVDTLDAIFSVKENFDILKKTLIIGEDELTLYFIDGFVKDAVMQKMMVHFLSLKSLGERTDRTAQDFLFHNVPYVEADVTDDIDTMTQMLLSGATVILGSAFLNRGIVIDARTYPARETAEPENDRVIKGARDGFVETLIFNTALIRRRIRDPKLKMSYMSVGTRSKTDVVVCYIEDKADLIYVNTLKDKISSIKVEALSVGTQSLVECLIPSRWYNPFPKVRTTERPDAAAAQLMEGNVLIICDNSPEVIILPASIFDFMQDTNDFYFPPLTGSYLRILRYVIFFMTLLLMPLWLIAIHNPDAVPPWLEFVLPTEHGRLPIIIQLFLAEFVIDGLRLASMNTPGMLSNSLSVIGGLILGDFSIQIGWLIPEVVLYGAFVAIANFSQRNYELGYAFKFLRLILLLLTWFFNIWGFLVGIAIILLLLVSNKTLNGERSYLYPLIPFNAKALKRMIFRVKK